MSNPRPHQLVVGDRAHRIVTAALHSEQPLTRSAAAIMLARCGRRVFADHPIDYRTRESLLDAVTAAGVYLHRFRPASNWRLVADELTVGGNRFDLVHRSHQGTVLIDELKLGVGRSAETAVREQIDRYLEAGSRLWGSSFIGVRLCAVHEPLQSRLYLPDRRRPRWPRLEHRTGTAPLLVELERRRPRPALPGDDHTAASQDSGRNNQRQHEPAKARRCRPRVRCKWRSTAVERCDVDFR